jgi:DNA-binding CsgD family transcriptional regulator
LPSARRAAHRALASALEVGAGRAGYEPDSRAWHLAAAAMGDDDQAADALELSALSARARRGSSAAARAFERSARLTASRSKRARRLYEAALDFLFTPEAQRAGPLLFEALSLIDDPLLRADVQRARAVAEMFRGPSEVNIETLIAEADLVEPIDVGRAAAMRADACMASTMVGDVARTLELARRAHESAQQAGPHAVAVSQAVLANALILSGQSQKAQAYLDFAREAFERDGLPPFPFLLHMIQTLGHAATWVEEYDQARQFLGAMVSAARAQSAAAGLAFALSCLSELDYRTGKWAEAYAHAAESERIATELGERNEVPFALVCLARVEAASGREAECQAHVAQALHISRELGSGSIEVYAGSVLGLLELGLGRPRQALAHLGPLALLVDRFQLAEPNVVPWAADHIEALVRAGDTSSAQAALASFERQAVATERRWALAESARCRGLLASDDEFEDCFEEALRWLDGRVALFETARARLCLGERQRRARRVGPARESLTAALAGFEQLGAQPWALRARQELRASGARLGPLADQPVQRLTAQELQVALAVASGATNREVAASLFLSPKTVDFHLGKVYRKLQVRSRSELAALLAGPRSVISKSV